MARKIIIMLAGIFLGLTNNAFAIDTGWNNWYSADDWRHFLPAIRPMAFLPQRHLIAGPMVEEKTVAVSITNNNGSTTEVKLIATADGGYTGPKGEYYSSMPTEEQLKALYGLPCTAPVRNNIIVYLGKINVVEKVVVLTKDSSGFVGPKGEHYQNMPTEEELRLTYGR